LYTSEQRYRTLVETMGDGLSEIDENQVTTYANEMLCKMWGRSKDEIVGRKVDRFLDSKNKKILSRQLKKRREGEKTHYEIIWTKKDGSRLHTIMTPTPYFDAIGNFKGSFAVITDISRQKNEMNLLEMKVKQRTQQLEDKKNNLEDMNTALRVLLKQREEDKKILEESMMVNVRELVMPYIEKMKETRLNQRQEGYIDMMESTLDDIVSPFLHRFSLEFLNLSPSEIKVANLVKLGKTTKEIAHMLNLSGKTIEFYRKRIRKKVGITNKNINLHTFLSSIK